MTVKNLIIELLLLAPDLEVKFFEYGANDLVPVDVVFIETETCIEKGALKETLCIVLDQSKPNATQGY